MYSTGNWKEQLPGILRNPRIIFAQDLSWPGARAVLDHAHDCYQLDYFYKGTGRLSVAGVEYEVRPGDLFITNPNTRHNFEAAREWPMEGISFKFDIRENDTAPEFPAHVCNLGILSRNQQREMEHYLRRACEEANAGRDESHQLAAALLSVFFLLLLRYVRDIEEMTSSESDLTVCERVMEYIRLHYSRQITLADLARIAGREPRYFCRRFSRERGISPIAALTQERMRAAKKLLTLTRLPVGEVGQRVGYQDTYHFSKRFKEVVGLSPRLYRESTAPDPVAHSPSPDQ